MSLTSGSASTFSAVKTTHKRSVSTTNAQYASVASSTSSSLSSSPSLFSAKSTQEIINNKLKTEENCLVHYPLLEHDTSNNSNHIPPSQITSVIQAPIESQLAPIFPVSILVNQNTDPKVSTKSNDRFHKLFPSVPIEEYVIETYSCAYVKSLNLLQGVMFLTKNFICFYSKIITHETILIIKFSHINSITKSMQFLIFPTQIRIETRNSIYSFTSFRSRSNTLDHLSNLLLQSRQRDADNIVSTNTRNTKEQIEQLNKTIELSNKVEKNIFVPLAINSDKIKEKSNERDELKIEKQENNFNNQVISDHSIKKDSIVKNETFTGYSHLNCLFNENNKTTNNYIYDLEFNSKNTVTVSIRHKKTLSQKIKILLGIIIPGFLDSRFDISRIDALLPICFTMCILLLLNAFVLLNKVNQVDDLFSKILSN